METGYNGWKNYATWLVALHLDNDENAQTYWTERATEIAECALHCLPSFEHLQDHYLRDPANVRGGRISMLEDVLRASVEEECEEGLEGLRLDLIGSVLSTVDWRRIAERYLERADEVSADVSAHPEGGAA